VSAALSNGELLTVPGLTTCERRRTRRLQRKLARARRGSTRRARVKHAIARLRARETDRRKDWVEKTSTDLARRFDVIRVEGLPVKAMTRSARGTTDTPGRNVRAKAGLNRGILKAGWSLLVTRLEAKAPGRVEKINPAYTSQTCHACKHVAPDNRDSQAVFRCLACGHTDHADINAARNIADGRSVTARADRHPMPKHVKRQIVDLVGCGGTRRWPRRTTCWFSGSRAGSRRGGWRPGVGQPGGPGRGRVACRSRPGRPVIG